MPVWPIEERPVPTDSDVPGEQPYATQPFPSKPPAFSPQGVSLEDANDLTPAIHALAVEEMQKYRIGPLFTPPSMRGTLQRPTTGGGANWGGAAFDAASGYLFVRAANGVTNNRIGKNDGSDTLVDVEYSNQFAARGAGSGLGAIPLIKPPYATLTALDLNKGEIAWQTPVGEGSPAVRNHSAAEGRHAARPARIRQQRRCDRDRGRPGLRWRRRQVPLRVRQDDWSRSLARRVAVHKRRNSDDLPDAIRSAVHCRRHGYCRR